jgi:hypothetical protein
LGTIAATSARLAFLAIDNAGTVELAIVNLAGGNNLDETTLISTTAISAAATAANVIYSVSARANVPFRVVGFLDIIEATAGTWASAPTLVQGVGGTALAALSSLGYGQTYQNVTASRSAGTTYYNTTGRAIFVSVINGGGDSGVQILVNGSQIAFTGQSGGAGNDVNSVCAIVPPGANYLINVFVSNSLTWMEMR